MTALTVEERFEAWNRTNPDFYRLFCKFTEEVLATGRRIIGANAIVERIRWESLFAPVGAETFKVNDLYTSRFTRKFMDEHPHHGEVFPTRRLRTR